MRKGLETLCLPFHTLICCVSLCQSSEPSTAWSTRRGLTAAGNELGTFVLVQATVILLMPCKFILHSLNKLLLYSYYVPGPELSLSIQRFAPCLQNQKESKHLGVSFANAVTRLWD